LRQASVTGPKRPPNKPEQRRHDPYPQTTIATQSTVAHTVRNLLSQLHPPVAGKRSPAVSIVPGDHPLSTQTP